eukprot:427390-Alexandrium_andersonii.AAC.1
MSRYHIWEDGKDLVPGVSAVSRTRSATSAGRPSLMAATSTAWRPGRRWRSSMPKGGILVGGA